MTEVEEATAIADEASHQLGEKVLVEVNDDGWIFTFQSSPAKKEQFRLRRLAHAPEPLAVYGERVIPFMVRTFREAA